jgi:hypothetical protein
VLAGEVAVDQLDEYGLIGRRHRLSLPWREDFWLRQCS